jgi:hypothetical protein
MDKWKCHLQHKNKSNHAHQIFKIGQKDALRCVDKLNLQIKVWQSNLGNELKAASAKRKNNLTISWILHPKKQGKAEENNFYKNYTKVFY